MRRALFGCNGRELSPEMVLLTRLIAIAWLVTGHAFLLSRSAPFFGVLLPFSQSVFVSIALLIVGLSCAINLVLARGVRASAIALGTVIFVTTLLSRAYFSNNRVFTACVLVLAGLAPDKGPPRLLRAQIVFLYLAAALDKIFDADWRSGAFLRSFATGLASHGRLWSPGHDSHEPYAPARMVAAFFDAHPGFVVVASFAAIALEISIGLLFLFGARRAAIACGLGFHVGVLLYTGSPMGMFFYTATASYFSFVELPARVELAAPARHHAWLSRVVAFFDPDERAVLRASEWKLSGILRLPAFYVLLALILAGPWFSPWLSLLALVALLPTAEVRKEPSELNA